MNTKTITKWIGRLISTVLILVMGIMIYSLVSTKITGGEPQIFGYQIKTVLSGSMEPGIKTGSIIAVKPVTNYKNLIKGDVITFRAADDPNTFITHRIVKVEKVKNSVQFITKGDNNESNDPSPVTPGNVVAKYSGFTMPYVGEGVEFMKSKSGAIWMFIFPGVLLILYSVFSIWRAISQYEVEKKKIAPE